jgi:hypothetical protein
MIPGTSVQSAGAAYAPIMVSIRQPGILIELRAQGRGVNRASKVLPSVAHQTRRAKEKDHE